MRNVREIISLNGGIYDSSHIRNFNNFISNMEIKDLPLIGRGFTWYKPNGTTKSRIDRFMVSRDWFIV
uniref:Uncharacterized protein n=1 Tax=Cajanus cajan TaxID=3821 RepID=A0A151SA07_CAJCA|nr:hypothetical protein KK1_026516 [Cajanus cajan]